MMPERFALLMTQRTAARRARTVQRELARGLPVLATTAATAVFCGLLLTCWGIVGYSFPGYSGSPTAYHYIVTDRLADSLLFHGCGLLTAICAFVGHRLLTHQLDRFSSEMALAVSALPASLKGVRKN